MAKETTSFRISPEAKESIARLQSVWGYDQGRGETIDAALLAWEWCLHHAAGQVSQKFRSAEWCMIADICNGTMWAHGHAGSSPALLLAAEIEDGHRLDGAGYRWLSPAESDLPNAAERAAADDAARDLVRRLAALEYSEAWAVIRAVCWFWQHPDVGLDVSWWTPEFRRDYRPAVEGEGDAPASED